MLGAAGQEPVRRRGGEAVGGLEARDRLQAQAGEFRAERLAKRSAEYGQAAIGERYLRQVR